ncbi:MAG: C13 family peptidase [Paracoccaceae bacterium]
MRSNTKGVQIPEPPNPPLLARSVENLSTVLGIWHASCSRRLIHHGMNDALVPALLLLVAQVLSYRVLQPFAAINIQVLQNFAGATALALVALMLVLVVMRKSAQAWQLCVGVLWALVIGNLLSMLALAASDATSLADWMFRKFGVTYVFALIFLIFRLGWHGLAAFAGFIVPTALVAAPWFASLGTPPANDDVVLFDPDTEMIYAAQNELLEQQTTRLRPGIPGTPELFAVLGAGYPYEGVFRREVEAVEASLSDRFAAENRVISLVNDDADLTSYPLMNRVNLRAALEAISTAMNPEDVALLFLTSHGAPGIFSTTFYDVVSRDLTAVDLDDALQEAGIDNVIVVLSACYSGSFVETLSAPNRLILTAADADNVSFGCNDQNEWTDWGRAFFVDALAQTRDFREAARIAQIAVARQEKAESLPPSSPLIFEGERIGRILDAWLENLD